ncbi:hypothetical protein [Clavibacter zhangzhiyongii]
MIVVPMIAGMESSRAIDGIVYSAPPTASSETAGPAVAVGQPPEGQ